MISTPLLPACVKLANRQSARLQFCGDSTTRGFGDTLGYGYPGRLGAKLGVKYDVTVEYKRYNIATGLYDLDNQILHTSTTDDTVLEIYNGGVDGAAINSGAYNATTYYANGLVPATPDAFFFGYGFNDYNSLNHISATFVSQAKTFIANLMNDHPDAPVIVTDQNVVYGHAAFNWAYGGSLGQVMNTFWGGLFQEYIGKGVYLDPILQQSVSQPRIWCLDTLAAQDWHYDPIYVSAGVHPNADGYELTAQLVFDTLVPDVVIGDIPVQVSTSLPTLFIGHSVSKMITLSAGTEPIVWSISSGSLPTGLSFNTSTGEISGTPIIENEAFDFTVTATNDWGEGSQRFVGTVSPAFHARTPTKTLYKLGGQYYPISPSAKIGGNFVGVMAKN